MRTTIALPNQSITLEYDKNVYPPSRSDIGTVVMADHYARLHYNIVDVGCGSGIIALALKQLNPHTHVTAVDVDPKALKCTKNNADRLELDIEVFKSDLLEEINPVEMVVANLPTYDGVDMVTHPLYAPPTAYKADPADGLSLYRRLFEQARTRVVAGGYLIVECQEKLQSELKKLSEDTGFHLITRSDFTFVFIRPV